MVIQTPVKILIVEDDLKELMTQAFQIVGRGLFRCEFAETATEAIRKASYFMPDIILMDLRIPKGGGVSAIRGIRKFMPDVPIISMTAFPQSHSKESALEAGANVHITKPIDIDTLIETIKNLTQEKEDNDNGELG